LEEEARKIFKNSYIATDFLTVKITPPPEKKILNVEKTINVKNKTKNNKNIEKQ